MSGSRYNYPWDHSGMLELQQEQEDLARHVLNDMQRFREIHKQIKEIKHLLWGLIGLVFSGFGTLFVVLVTVL